MFHRSIAVLLAAVAVGGAAAQDLTPEQIQERLSSPAIEIGTLEAAAPVGPLVPRQPDLREAAERPRNGFYHQHLLPRMASRLEGMSASLDAFSGTDLDNPQDLRFEENQAALRQGVERATLKALKAWALEASSLERYAEQLIDRARGRSGDASVGEADGAVDGGRRRTKFKLGFHSFLPEVEVKTPLGDEGSLRLAVSATGSVGLRYRPGPGSTEFRAGFDGDDAFAVNFRFAF
jgi:hypothetical protein